LVIYAPNNMTIIQRKLTHAHYKNMTIIQRELTHARYTVLCDLSHAACLKCI